MVMKDIKSFLSKAFQNVPKTGDFGSKINHLATLQTNGPYPSFHDTKSVIYVHTRA
jgi:hypothetical protein